MTNFIDSLLGISLLIQNGITHLSCDDHITYLDTNEINTTTPVLFIHGGGQHGTILWGVLNAFLKSNKSSFQHFAGVSFGAALAIWAAMYSHDSTESGIERLFSLCTHMKIHTCERILDQSGMHDFVDCLFIHEKDLTLLEVHNRYFPSSTVDILTTNSSTFHSVVMNHLTFPHVKLKDALRASMAIPLFIGSYELNGMVCIDGDITSIRYKKLCLPHNSVILKMDGDTQINLGDVFNENSFGQEWYTKLCTFFKLISNGYDCTPNGTRVYSVPVRDTSQTVFGGLIGNTIWHFENFQFGFNEMLLRL